MRTLVLATAVAVFTLATIAKPILTHTLAQSAGGEPNARNTDGEQPKPEVVLRQMADYISNLPAISCHVDLTIQLQAPGIDRRVDAQGDLRFARPNRLALISRGGDDGMSIVSDGKHLVYYAIGPKRYTVQDAPPDFAVDGGQYLGVGVIGVPTAYLSASGEQFYMALMDGVNEAKYIGMENVGDVSCHRCRFVRDNASWDVWIEAGDRPLVHKVVPDLSKQLASSGPRLKDAKLEYSIVFSDWNVAPKFAASDFAFEPPADAEKVDSLSEGLAGGPGEGPHPLLGQPAPAFKTVDLDEKPIDLRAHLGKSVVMLDFWATWCGPCVEAMPHVGGVARQYADRGLVFYAVNVGEDADTIKEFLKSQELDVSVAMDQDNSIAQQYQASGIPQTVLIGKDGKVQVVHVGFAEGLAEILSQQVEELLTGKNLASRAETSGPSTETARDDSTAADEPQSASASE